MSAVPAPRAGADDGGQQALIAQLRMLITPDIEGSPERQRFCTDACLRRFLVSRRWDLQKAAAKLRATLEWRSSFKPEQLLWADVEAEGCTGKLFVLDFTDKAGRPIVLMRPRCENTKAAEGQIKHLVYNLERACAKADALGVEKMTVLIDFEGYSLRNAPPFQTSRETLAILQGHYPERLGAAVCFHPPTLFSVFWKAISPFIDPVTYEKIKFCSKGVKGEALMRQLFDIEQLEECLGGSQPPLFNLAVYSAARKAEEAAKAQPAAPGAAAANGVSVAAA